MTVTQSPFTQLNQNPMLNNHHLSPHTYLLTPHNCIHHPSRKRLNPNRGVERVRQHTENFHREIILWDYASYSCEVEFEVFVWGLGLGLDSEEFSFDLALFLWQVNRLVEQVFSRSY